MRSKTIVDGGALILEPGSWRPGITSTWLTQPFWDAARIGRLIVQRCDGCRAYVFRPQYACTRCTCTNLQWVESSGRGVINSFSVVRRPAYPDLPEVYVVVVVAMEEGWSMMSNIVGCDVDAVRIDQDVRAKFVDFEEFSLPFMVPDVTAGTVGRN